MKLFISILLLFIWKEGLAQQPVFICDDLGYIYSVDLTDCSSRLIGGTNPQIATIALTPDGKLWGIGEQDAYLYQIDTANASTTLIGRSYGTYTNAMVGLNDSTLLGVNADAQALYGINVKNGQSYLIGSVGAVPCGDLAWYVKRQQNLD
jgi:hypothetical protein